MRIAIALAIAGLACAGGPTRDPEARPDGDDLLAPRFPLAFASDRELCDQLLARSADDYRVTVDPEPRTRRKVIVSDLHLGPGIADPRFTGIEDFYSDAEWTAFLARQGAAGPTDLIIDGDFIEFWQIAAALGVLPKADSGVQPSSGPVLAGDQAFAMTALELVVSAHKSVFHDLGAFLASGDNRVIVIAGNHDADVLWPRVQLAIARAIDPKDPARLVFVQGAAYEHGGVHVEHGHAFDAANHFATGYAPFGRDRTGACRLQSSWGEIFVDRFYTDTERQVPFIDNLYPESAAVLWAMRDNPDPKRDLGAVLRFLQLVRTAETRTFNRDAAKGLLQTVLGTPGANGGGPESVHEVIDHITDQLIGGDKNAESIIRALFQLRYDPELAGLWTAIGRAAIALPDFSAALGELRAVDPDALVHLRDKAFGSSMETAAKNILATRRGIHIVVLGHTHEVGGLLVPLEGGYYANTGSWISVASVAELRARGVTWDKLTLADRTMFPSRTTAIIIEYAGGVAQK
jgi:UDP-2,3-diacylglucosamine pyrophosphatase LpxH